jgi:hypothetical protein
VKKEKKVVEIYTTENYKAMSKLQEFSTQELESELLSRKICQFNKPLCQKKAAGYFIKQVDGWQIQANPICFNCQEYIKKAMNYETIRK